MNVEIAGVPFAVRWRYEENLAFFRDYPTDRAPQFLIAPTEEDLERAQADCDRTAEREGLRVLKYGRPFLENTAVFARLAEKLVEYDVLLLHASALCMDGEAVLFAAPSGTGKSTHARLWRETFGDRVLMLNDDKPFLRITDGGVTAFGSPWDGKHHLSRNASAPVRAFVWLRRAERNHAEPMTKAEAFPILAAQAFGTREPTLMRRVLALERTLLDRVTLWKLGCNMEPEAASCAREAIFRGTAC